MSVQDFTANATKKRHPAYDDSMLAVTAAEWSTGEDLLGATYRRLILGVSEGVVDLADIPRLASAPPPACPEKPLWEELLVGSGGIRSPFRSGQGSQSARQLMPVVPAAARVSNVQGRPRNRWSPSSLLLETLGAGAGPTGATQLVRQLGASLMVNGEDDVFARYVEAALREDLAGLHLDVAGTPPFLTLAFAEKDARAWRGDDPARQRRTPAERFCADLPAILMLKDQLTRRQWTVLVEAILRVGLGLHVLWVCHANWVLWQRVLAVAGGAPVPSDADIARELWESHRDTRPLLEIGAVARPFIDRLIEQYSYARVGLNLALFRLDDVGAPWQTAPIGASATPLLAAPSQVGRFLTHVSANRARIDPTNAEAWLQSRVTAMFDDQPELRALANRERGFTRNLFFFIRYGLGQIESREADLMSYDQSYLLAYPGPRRPLIVQPGPAMLITLVHACCQAQPQIPTGLEDFRQHLADYGLRVPAGELGSGRTGSDLGKLGLVVDSPDAAGGRLLVPPF